MLNCDSTTTRSTVINSWFFSFGRSEGMKGVSKHMLFWPFTWWCCTNSLFFPSPPVKGKRKANSTDKSLTKKAKLVNDGMNNPVTAKFLHLVTCVVLRHPFCVISGFCVFVGNLNKSKTFDEIKDTLASYFMTHSLLVQDIRLDQSR